MVRLPGFLVSSLLIAVRLAMGIGSENLIARTCVVKEKALEQWYEIPGDQASWVVRPKLIVDVITSHVHFNFTSMVALRYGHGAENTSPPADYGEAGPQGYLSNFTIGQEIPCWQDADEPEDIRLEDSSAVDMQAFHGFIASRNSPLIVLTLCLFAIVASLFACVRRYRKPGFDVKFPWMRRYCFNCCPWLFIFFFFVGFLLQRAVGGKALQHKFFQPMLIGILITFVIVYAHVLSSRKCQEVLPTNITLVVGIPVYFKMFWVIVFVTLVPGFNWMHVWKGAIKYILTVYKFFGLISGIAFNFGFVIFICAYWDKITRAFGWEGSVNGGSLLDLIDPHGRKNNFIAVKIAVMDIVGKLPANASIGANNLYVKVLSSGNEPARTRTHNAQEAGLEDSKVYALHEVLQFNIPMDYTSIENIHIKVLDEGMITTNEIGRVCLRVCDIYDEFFDPTKKSGEEVIHNTHKEVRVGHKIKFMKNGEVCDLQQSAKAYEIQFNDFRGPAYLWLGFLPGNEEAVRYLDSLYTAGGLGSYLNCMRTGVGGVGTPDDYEMSEYTRLGEQMENSSHAPLSTRPGGTSSSWRTLTPISEV